VQSHHFTACRGNGNVQPPPSSKTSPPQVISLEKKRPMQSLPKPKGFSVPERYLAVRCRSGPASPARSIPTGHRRPGHTAPGPGRGRRRRGGWPARWCSRAGLPATGRAACGRGHCAGWPGLPPWGWRASGCTACGPRSCARAGGCCSPPGCSGCLGRERPELQKKPKLPTSLSASLGLELRPSPRGCQLQPWLETLPWDICLRRCPGREYMGECPGPRTLRGTQVASAPSPKPSRLPHASPRPVVPRLLTW